jgi:F0F1-type ATP synthase membrane subunit b/b'
MVLDGRFRIVEAIGRGGFGEVFRADELLPGGAAIRQVALKVLSPGADLDAWAEEAKLLASFSHPALVTVLAAGLCTLADGVQAPFVAMELLDGETLGALLGRAGRLPWRRVLAWARDVAAALDVIHARGVVHLDLKPTNLFLTQGGALKVLDFGIARRAGAVASPRPGGATAADDDASLGTAEFLAEREATTGSTGTPSESPRRAIVGTPGYMAPEVLEERPATAAADAYALAACIVHLATGRLPHDVPAPPGKGAGEAERRAFWDEVRHATSVGRLRDLEEGESGLPRGVASLCLRLLALEPSARDVAPGGLRALVDAAWERPFGVPDPPYLGLAAFGPAAEGMLFGRDDDVARLGHDLETEVALVLQGVSGSGKSSLAMAGVLPALARRDAATGPDWRVIAVRPGVDPDAALARALSTIAPDLGDASAAEAAAFARARGLGLGFVFDQLEELVTQADAGKRGRFVAFLAEAAGLGRDAPLRVVGTLREDFTSTILGIEPLGEILRDALRFVGPPTMAAVRAIVAQPAELSGVRVEGVGEVASDVERELRAGDGRLPLVALALSAWWKTREGGALTAAAYRKLGGVRAIFANLADGVFTGLDEAAQAEARAALMELSSDGRTRRSLQRGALRERARSAAAFDRAVDAFVAAGLVIEAGGAIEVVHEFLFTAWDRLDGWLADARASRRVAAALREGARNWQELGRPVTRLPSDAEVALARLVLAEGGLEGEDAELQKEWVRAAERRATFLRWRAAAVAAAVLAVGLVALGAWGKMVSDAQARVEASKREADAAAERARENEERANRALRAANEAQEEADKSRKDRQRAAEIARLQQAEFERLLHEAETETQRARVRCNVLERRERIKDGACAPNDPLCIDNMARPPLKLPDP